MSEPRRPDHWHDPESRPQPNDTLPPFKVVLHDDHHSEMGHVVKAIMELTRLAKNDAILRMQEAHLHGLAVLLKTHRERAELYVEQFAARQLTVTVEPA
jgi:ATP-dependent Clp protease adapter protein ClpS